jgi:hypothetical protein
MGFNLISLIKGYFNDEVINLVSRAVGGTNEQTQAAVDAITPALLSKLSQITSSKLATEALFQSVNNQDESILDNLAEQLVEDNHTKLVSSGSFYINSLLGIRGIRSLIEGVSKNSGISQHSSSSLLGILMPVVLSTLKNKLIEDDKLSSPGVIEALNEQEQWISEYIPADFFVDEVEVEKEVVQLATAPSIQSHKPDTSIVTKLFPLLLLPVILFFTYHFYYKKPDLPMMLPGMQTISELNANSKFSIEEHKSLEELSLLLGSVENLLSEITDQQSAKIKLAGLEKKVKSLDILSQKMQGMSQATRLEAATLVKSKIPQMQATVNRIHKIPGGTVTIKPVMDQLIKISVDAFI